MARRRAKWIRPMDSGEIRRIPFDFTDDLGTETIFSFDPVSVSVYRGTDSTPNDILSGSSSQTGAFIYQVIDGAGAVPDTDYKLRARVTTNTGRKLVLTGILPVRTA